MGHLANGIDVLRNTTIPGQRRTAVKRPRAHAPAQQPTAQQPTAAAHKRHCAASQHVHREAWRHAKQYRKEVQDIVANDLEFQPEIQVTGHDRNTESARPEPDIRGPNVLDSKVNAR